MAAYRSVSYSPTDAPLPDDIGGNDDSDSDVELFGAQGAEEKRVLENNRTKLTQYIHDCTILFPYMKQEKVFTNDDCDLVKNEITGTLKVDKFIDIILSKGPRAIGKFHEALAKDYPAIFDVLSRWFSNSGISLPPSRQIKDIDDWEDFDEHDLKQHSDPNKLQSRGLGRVSLFLAKHGRSTIKKHFKELDKQCEEAKSQKDVLQKALIQRETEINQLLRNRDIWMQQNLVTVNEKYQDLLVQLVQWREQVVTQSDGNIDLLVKEREAIQEEYGQLEAEYMLTVSELMAAKDRISKLLGHLEQTDKEVTIAAERQQDLIAQLEDKVSQLEGENQRLQRKLVRREPVATETPKEYGCDSTEAESETNEQLTKVAEERDDFKTRMEAALRERKGTLDELDQYIDKLHTEKQRRRLAEKELKIVRSHPTPVEIDSLSSTRVAALTSSWSPSSYQQDPVPEELLSAPGANRMQEVTIVLPAQGSEMQLGLGVVVREVDTDSKAWKSGVRVGDEIQQINHITITTDSEPLAFARKLLGQASGTVTLYIKRQNIPGPSHASLQRTPHTGTPVSPYSGGSLGLMNPLDLQIKRWRQYSEGYSPTLPGRHIPSTFPLNFKMPSTTSTSARDTSGSEESDFSTGDSYPYNKVANGRDGYQATNKQHGRESDNSGIISSPRISDQNPKPDTHTLRDKLFTLSEQSSIYPQRILPGSSDSDSPQPSPHDTPSVGFSRKREKNKVIRPRRHTPRKSGCPNPAFDTDEANSPLDNTQHLLTSCPSSDVKRVLLASSQLGDGVSIIGGRGHGIFILSDGHRRQSSDFQTGDEIIQIAHKSVQGWTYCQVMEALESFSLREACMITLRSNIEGFSKLPSTSARDNFYVRARLSHQKSNKLGDLGYQRGDIFRVTDTKPEGQVCVWGAEKINSKGDLMESGFLPLKLDPQELSEAPGGGSGVTLPNMTVINTQKGILSPLYTLQANSRCSQVTTEEAFQLYEPIRKVEATDPRPVVLVGSHDGLIRRHLVEHGSDAEIKFAYCHRKPAKSLEGVSRDKIVESIETGDGLLQSTVDYVNEIAKKGLHCVLCVEPSDLPSPGVTALTPIVLLLNPKKNFKIKQHLKTVPSGCGPPKPSLTVEQTREIGRKYKIYITGQIELSGTMYLNDIIQAVRSTVARQQKSVVWEVDH